MKKGIVLLLLSLVSTVMNAQVEMADTMRSNGKIYVVVAVLCVVFAVITAYIYSVDRKISRIEKDKK